MWVWQSFINKRVSTSLCVTQVNNTHLTTVITARYACLNDLLLDTHVELAAVPQQTVGAVLRM